jgi:thioesterase domain-containing protein
MAETLAADNWPLRSDLAIGLRTTGSLEPLFCVASPEVNTVGYALLARYQDEDRPIYVLQAPPDDQSMRRLSPREIPGMATTYLQELRGIQPHGPYYLLGMCTGSQIVLEMARQLDKDGERPVFAGIINTWAHFTVSRLYYLQRLLHIGRWYAGRLRELWQLKPREQYAELQRVLKRRSSALTLRLARDSAMEGTPTNMDPANKAVEQQDNSDPWIAEFGWAHNDPQVEKYAGTLTVFRIRRQQYWRTGEADLGWGKHAQHVHVERLPGKTHEAVLREPHVQIIGKRIAERIEKANNKDKK